MSKYLDKINTVNVNISKLSCFELQGERNVISGTDLELTGNGQIRIHNSWLTLKWTKTNPSTD